MFIKMIKNAIEKRKTDEEKLTKELQLAARRIYEAQREAEKMVMEIRKNVEG